MALECQEILAVIQIRNKASVDKLAFAKEKVKKTKAEAKVKRTQKVEYSTKLDPVLTEIEALKREV